MTISEARQLKKGNRVRLVRWFRSVSGTVIDVSNIGFEVKWDDGLVFWIAFEDAGNVVKD